MKSKLHLLAAIILLLPQNVFAQKSYVPDDNFEQALIDLGYDSGELNDSVNTVNISSITSLSVNGKNISDLKGIEDFTSLTNLNCGNNNLVGLNLSNNFQIAELYCFNNQLTNINLRSNSGLTKLFFYNNNIAEVDLSANSLLETLNCSNNRLINLNLSENSLLKYINCSNNELSSLNLKNGNNSNMTGGSSFETGIDCRNNPDLYCIQVDNAENAVSYYTWFKDSWSGYTEDCSSFEVRMAYVPDDNFEQALIDLGYDSGQPDDYVPTTSISKIKTLSIYYKDIYDLTGIEEFKALETLDCRYNQLSSLRLESNVNLITLYCSNNQIPNIDLSSNTQLKRLDCSSNNLADLDLSSNYLLIYLNCYKNRLTSLNIRNGNNNNLSSLDSRLNPDLLCIQVDDENEAYSQRYWSKNNYTIYSEDCANHKSEMTFIPDDNFEQVLIDLGYDYGPINDSVITAIVKHIKALSINTKKITDLTGIEDFVSLETLRCASNQITKLDLSSNINLKILECQNNDISDLDLSKNILLSELNCFGNSLLNLNLNSNIKLTELNCTNNSLVDLDLSSNPEMTYLNCYNNELSGLNLRNGNNTNMNFVDVRSNANLFCIEVDDPELCYQNSSWQKDLFTEYTLDCHNHTVKMTYIPDDNFEQALINMRLDFTDLNDSVPTIAIKYLKSLTIAYKDIVDLTGIEDFIKLENLNCNGNQLSTLSLDKNINLKELNCIDNKLTKLNLGENLSLSKIRCRKNKLAHINLQGVKNLSLLDISENLFTNIDLNSVNKLETFSCDYNSISIIDLSSLNSLLYFSAKDNKLSTLDLSSNTALKTLDVNTNQLTELNLQNGNNNISNIDVKNNPDLLCIQVDDPETANQNKYWIESSYVIYSKDCTKQVIKRTYIPDDAFEQALIDKGLDYGELDDSVFTESIKDLKSLDIDYENISDLTGIEDFVALESLNCWKNNISQIDLSANKNLKILDLRENKLSQLNLKENLLLTKVSCNNNELTDIDVSANSLLTQLQVNYNKLTSLDLSQNNSLSSLHATNNNLTSIDLRNGNNSNMWVYISNNPDLLCVQVDDPLAAYENTKWTKDYYAGYSDDCSNYKVEMTYVPDDIFEQELINRGFDYTGLNDSVPTVGLRYYKDSLQLNEKEIKDLTGIEEFVELTRLECRTNQIINLDLRSNTKLRTLWCDHNNMSNLLLPPNLEYIWAFSNNLLEIDFLQNSIIKYISVSNNKITNIDVSKNPLLSGLSIGNNQISNIDLSLNPNLDILYCEANKIESLDFSANKVITHIECRRNELNNINITECLNLRELNCQENKLTFLDLSNNSKLEFLESYDNNLRKLNIKNGNNIKLRLDTHDNPELLCIQVDNPTASENNTDWKKDEWASYSEDCNYKIQMTYVPDNNFEQYLIDQGYDYHKIMNDSVPVGMIDTLTYLDISNKAIHDLTGIEAFVSLETLICDENQLSSVDLSHCIELMHLSCKNNAIVHLDLNNLAKLKDLNCGENSLITLDLRNNTVLNFINCSNNALTSLDLRNGNNQEIEKITTTNNPDLLCMQVDNVNQSINNSNWQKDSWTEYSEDCRVKMTYVPDNNFEQALIDLGFDSGELNDSVFTANIDTITFLNVSSKGIKDLTGIEAFVALETLLCGGNLLSSLDLSKNTSLTYLSCSNNQLTRLDLSKNTNLKDGLNCHHNLLTYLNVDNTKLNLIYCHNNRLSSLDVCHVPNLVNLSCFDNLLDSLDVRKNEALSILAISRNKLKKLDLSNNHELSSLACSDNNLTELNLTQCAQLKTIYCQSNLLSNIDLRGLTLLSYLQCENNLLEDLDLSERHSLHYLKCYGNRLSSLNVKNGNNSNFTLFDATQNPNLICIQVDSPDDMKVSTIWKKDEWASYEEYCNPADEVIPQKEYQALENIFNLFSDNEWLNNTIWLDTVNYTVNDWEGVTVENGHITELDLSGRELEGDISSFLAEFDSLTWLDLSDNNFSGQFSSLFEKSDLKKSIISEESTLEYLNIANNRFIFSDLEPSSDELNSINEFIYSPQAMTGSSVDTVVYKDHDIVLEIEGYISGQLDNYVWMKDGIEISSSNKWEFVIEKASLLDSGTYSCMVTNSLFPILKLYSDNIRLHVLIPTGQDELEDNGILVYPNPAHEKIFVQTADECFDLKVYSLSGTLIMERNDLSSGWVHTKKILPGIYVFRIIRQNKKVVNCKIIFK